MSEPSGPAVLEPGRITEIKTDKKQKLAPNYRVLIHNDDVTPMDFVVKVLSEIFKKNAPDAMEIMLVAHHTGMALVAVLPLEQAELRTEQAHSMARARNYPLTFTYEPEG